MPLGAGVPMGSWFCFDQSHTCQGDGSETRPILLKIGKRSAPKGGAGFTAVWRQPTWLQLSVGQGSDQTASL